MDVVRGVVPAVRVTRLPGAPDVVEGVVDVRGSLTPVFDPRRGLGLTPRTPDADDHLVHATAGTRGVLLRVDRVLEVATVADAEIMAPGDLVRGDAAVAGVTRVGPDLVLIHDLGRFLTAAQAAQLDRALAQSVTPEPEGRG